jgi:hypothetical protein
MTVLVSVDSGTGSLRRYERVGTRARKTHEFLMGKPAVFPHCVVTEMLTRPPLHLRLPDKANTTDEVA